MSVLSRLRANLGWLVPLAAMSLAAAMLLTAAPRVRNHYADQGLAEWIDSLGYRTRDITVTAESDLATDGRAQLRPVTAATYFGDIKNRLPRALTDRLAGGWYSTQASAPATGSELDPARPRPVLSLRDQSGASAAVTLVQGQWPKSNPLQSDEVQSAISGEVASRFGLQVGSTVVLHGKAGTVTVIIVGVFEAKDPDAGIWAEDAEREIFEPFTPVGTDPPQPWRAVLLTDGGGMVLAAQKLVTVDYTWRFRIDTGVLDVGNLPEVTEAALDARYIDLPMPPGAGASVQTGLDSALARFAGTLGTASALAAVVQTGVVGTLFGLVLLAAIAATVRRRNEFALLRSRGAGLFALGARVFFESALAVGLATIAGHLLGGLVPGRPGSGPWLVVAFASGAALAGPVLAMVAHRRVWVTGQRSELSRPRISARRFTGEATVVLLAVAAAYLLRRRGLGSAIGADGGGAVIDPLLVATPILVAFGAAVVALRVLPYPLRLVNAVTARARGAIAFLGLARAGRAAPATAGPLAVLVVAVSVGVFTGAVAVGVSAARDTVADIRVPGAAFVHGGHFSAGTRDRLARVAGVSDVASLAIELNQPLVSGAEIDARGLAGVTAAVLDAPALARVMSASGNSQHLPDVLVSAVRGPGPVPAVVSPVVAAELGGHGRLVMQGQSYDFVVAATATTMPGLALATDRFVALPWQALVEPAAKPVVPTGYLLAGANIDLAAATVAGDDGQREWLSAAQAAPYTASLSVPTTVDTHAEVRDALEQAGVDRVVQYTYVLGAGAGLLLALLAVGFLVATGARERGQALSRLRTMGLSQAQGQRLLAYELLPVIVAGALVGSVLGAYLPVLFGPALGLSGFSDGVEVAFAPDPRLAGVAFGVVLVAVVVAMLTEAAMNRWARLGVVLRVGGESS